VLDYNDNPVKGGQGMQTEHVVAGIVLGCLAALILLRRGFRGVSAGGLSVGIK
jgi:hypothetical protein